MIGALDLSDGTVAWMWMPDGDDWSEGLRLRGESVEASESGARYVRVVDARATDRRTYRFTCSGFAAIEEFEAFFDARLGKYEGFWMPTWGWELASSVYTDIDGTFLKAGDGLLESFAHGAPYRRIAVLRAGRVSVFDVLSAAMVDGKMRIALTDRYYGGLALPSGAPWLESEGYRIVWMRYVRFDDDALVAREVAGDTATYEVSVVDVPEDLDA